MLLLLPLLLLLLQEPLYIAFWSLRAEELHVPTDM
jgi:hypothetical protein